MDLSAIPESLQWFARYAERLSACDDGDSAGCLSAGELDAISNSLRPEFFQELYRWKESLGGHNTRELIEYDLATFQLADLGLLTSETGPVETDQPRIPVPPAMKVRVG